MPRLYRPAIVFSDYIVKRYIRITLSVVILSAVEGSLPTWRRPHFVHSRAGCPISRVLCEKWGFPQCPQQRPHPSGTCRHPFRILSPPTGDPVIPRYTRPEMARIWSDENRFRTWLAVEVAATETLAAAGHVPKAAAKAIRERANFKVERIHAIEAEVRHDVIAFTTSVAELVGPEARWFHYGLTSNDVVDTAQALLVKQASRLIDAGIVRLAQTLKKRAWEFKDTPQIGRTHGVHAEPITFGLKLANWYSETQRNLTRFRNAAEDMRVGKLSGAVGTLAHL